MEIFLEKIEAGGDQLDFQSFCMLFENGDDKRTLTKSNSVLSVRNIYYSLTYIIILLSLFE